MAASAKVFGLGLKDLVNKVWGTDVIKCALFPAAWGAPNQDTLEDYSAVGEVANGNGYLTGGVTLGTMSAAYDAGTNVISLGAANAVWSNATITARYALIYNSTTGKVIAYIDFGADVTSTNGTFTVPFTGGVIWTVTPAA